MIIHPKEISTARLHAYMLSAIAPRPIAFASTVDKNGNPVTIKGRGRHDPCVLPRAVPIVEAMAAITLADHWLRQASSKI